MFYEKHSRTIAKSITWRVIAFIATVAVVYALTQDWQMSIYHSIAIHTVKTVLFYLHERLWNLSNFGQELKTPTI